MNNPESGFILPELKLEKRQLAIRRPMGFVALNEAILATFYRADEYTKANSHLVGYNIDEWPSDLQIAHRDKDTLELTKFGISRATEEVHSVEVVIHRGGLARNGDIKYDQYKLSRVYGSESGLQHMTNGGYVTQLIEQDDNDEFRFAKGIGPKRQERSGKVLRVMQDRIQRLRESE